MPIWRSGDDLSLVPGNATVWWCDLTSPFGESASGVDWTIELPDGVDVLDPHQRPCFGTGPDAHRPHLTRDGQRLELSFPGTLPGENRRRPMTDPGRWNDLHWPLVVVASGPARDDQVRIVRRAVGDQDERVIPVQILEASDPATPTGSRCMQPILLPWFSSEEQAELAKTLGRCGFTDVGLNWHGTGLPLLPIDAYAVSARNLRREIPGVRVWIGGLPGADTTLPRAEAIYGQPIPFVASPEAAISRGRDLVVASERSWCEATEADGVMIALSEPAAVDTHAMPAHCFSHLSREKFATEQALPSVPDAISILNQHREAWVSFCCRQIGRLLEVARFGHGERPLAIMAYGPGGPARAEASADWQQLANIASILIYAHATDAPVDPTAQHWGYTRVAGTPQSWWEEWHDPLGTIPNRQVAVADAKMQQALSGGHGVRIGSWTALDGDLQQTLMAWSAAE